MKNFLLKSFILFLVIFLTIGFLSPSNLSADSQKVWVDTSHWDISYGYVEDWAPCDVTFVFKPKHAALGYSPQDTEREGPLTRTFAGIKYRCYKNTFCAWVTTELWTYHKLIHSVEYECFEVLTKKLVAYKKWVEEGHWEDYTESVGANEGDYDYEHEHKHVDSSLHGEMIVKKDPEYVFTKWHKDKYNNECSMDLSISWKVDNSNLAEGEEEKKIVRLHVYEDVCRFDNRGIEKVIIFDGNVSPSAEGNIDTVTKFEYSGSEESLLHIYLFDQNGESAHVCFSNPINGFRSINLMSEGSGTDANAWLGGIGYEKFEF